MKEEKEKWEKIIHSKLYDFEADVIPDDWAIISGKLPDSKTVSLHSYRKYGYVAAAITTLLILGGLYFYLNDDPTLPPNPPDPVAVIDDPGTDAIVEKTVEASLTRPRKMRFVQPDSIMPKEIPVRLELLKIDKTDSVVRNRIHTELAKTDRQNREYIQDFENIKDETTFYEKPLIADASLEKKHRRWGFGMGGGSYGVNPASGNEVSNNVFLRSSDNYIQDKEVMKTKEEDFMELRSGEDGLKTRPYEIPTGKIKHKTPISVGLGVSYYLDDRWSLQSGVAYTILRSEWSANNFADDLAESKQNLHYIGIPLSVSYRIAEWNRFQLYALAGGMCEFNVAGIYEETRTFENIKETRTESLRMKTPMWSVNARSGINYPLWKFINVYVEAGASYYFDNKSEIRTIRLDKPFNVSLQAGIRLGF
jgi:hypothetical protein